MGENLSKSTTKCFACAKENPFDINFCRHCRYPINVKKIDEFTKRDIQVSLASLLEVITEIKESLFDSQRLEAIYDELFSLNWLRPESALLRFVESKILLDFKDKYLKYPMLDLGCGDGIYTSILFGAKVNKNYDAYESIDFGNMDIYNDYTKLPVDFFISRPLCIGFGVDIKQNAVRKTRDLGVYDDVKIGDVRALPFKEAAVESIFSNMIDDIKREDLFKAFKEINRVVKTGGYFVFTTPTKRFREFLFYYNKTQKYKKDGDEEKASLFLNLDRGRSEWEPRELSLWVDLFKETSFELVEYVEYGDKNFFNFWDTGFRSFFHYLATVRNILRESDMYVPVKKICVEMMKNYFFKYAKNQVIQNGAFALIVAKKMSKK